jgi:ketosteroid isomerase-like protein
MKNSARTVVDRMFEAFASKNVDKILETVSDDTVWIYHGTQVIPKAEYKGRDGARNFFHNILKGTEVIKFQPEQFVVEGNMVVVLGHEHQKVKRTGKELKQKWVQVYTIKDDLIARMEEFATSEFVNQ